MPVSINKGIKVICQGFTGNQGTFRSEQAVAYGTQMVGDMTPGEGGTTHLGPPVFNAVHEAVEATGATATAVCVPASFCKDSILEAIDADIKLIIIITESILALDMPTVRVKLGETDIRVIGLSCPGVITPGEYKIDIMSSHVRKPGKVGVVSRPGTLTYGAVKQTTGYGSGQSTYVGTDGGPIPGFNFIDILKPFQEDPQVETIMMIGGIGGSTEEEAAACIKERVAKSVVGYIASVAAPKGRRIDHAGTITAGGKDTADEKFAALEATGVKTIRSLADIGGTLKAIIK